MWFGYLKSSAAKLPCIFPWFVFCPWDDGVDDELLKWCEGVWLKLSPCDKPECSKLPTLPPLCVDDALTDVIENGAGVSAGKSAPGKDEDALPDGGEFISWFDPSFDPPDPCNASLW